MKDRNKDSPAEHSSPRLELVRQLAAYAALPLPSDRELAVAEVLEAWLPEANALNEKMSTAAHQELVPATIFIHLGVKEGDM